MNESFYSFHTLRRAHRFEFISIGAKTVHKAVIYTETDVPYFYSLALLDIFDDGTSDDQSVSNNGDMEKILATVYQTLVVFFRRYDKAVVVFSGSTPSRTRLYRIAISNQLQYLAQVYYIWGIINDKFEPFQRNQPYSGFLISLKNTNIV